MDILNLEEEKKGYLMYTMYINMSNYKYNIVYVNIFCYNFRGLSIKDCPLSKHLAFFAIKKKKMLILSW